MQDPRFPSSQQPVAMANMGNVVLALKTSTLLLGIIALYFQDLSTLFRDALENGSTSYVLLVPLILAYLLYRKRKMLRATISTENGDRSGNTKHAAISSGILVCTTAIILYWYGSYTLIPLEYHILTLPIFTAGLTLVLFDPQTLRQAVFPVAFLAFLTPLPPGILDMLSLTLSVTSTQASNALVNLLGIHSTISSESGTPTINIIRPDSTPISFAPDIARSGTYGLVSFLIFAAFVAYIVRGKISKKIVIFFIGLPLIYLLNILRITISVLIGYQSSQQVALGMLDPLGVWLFILICTLILLAIAEKMFRSQIFAKKQRTDICQVCNPHVSTQTAFCTSCGRLVKCSPIRFRIGDAAKILVAALTIALLLPIQSPVFALTQGPARILVQTPTGEQGNTEILPQMPGYTTRFLLRDMESENVSGLDLSLVYEYTPQDQTKKLVWVSVEIAEMQTPLRPWEDCFVILPQSYGNPHSVNQLDLRDVALLENPQIVARYFGFQYNGNNRTQLVLYWFESTVLTINNTSAQKQVKLSLIAYPDKPEDVPSMEEYLLPFATAIVGYWQPIKTWAAIAMFVSQNGISLAGIPTTVLVALVILHVFDVRKQRRANATAYEKLSKPSQQLVNIIQKTEKRTMPTMDKLQTAYQEVTKERVDARQMEYELAKLEKIGVIKRSIVDRQDVPALTWKTQITFGIRKH